MAHRNLIKLVATVSVVLLFVAGMSALVALQLSPRPADTVEASRAHDPPPSASSSGDDHRQSTADDTANTTEPPPTTGPPATAADSTSSEGAGSLPGTEGGSAAGTTGGGTSGSTTTCPLPAYPSVDCTGVPAGASLTVQNGDLNISAANTVIDSKDIRGCVTVNAPGVVIRRSKITCSGSAVLSHASAYSGAGAVLEDVEISCANTKGATGVGDANVTIRRANIHSCENGFDIDGRMIVEHSYIHDLVRYDPATDPHTDGSQITPVGNNIRLEHNTIYAGDGTSAIISPNVSSGVVSNVLIKDNLLAGGTYTLYCQQGGPGNNYTVIGNHFSTVQYPSVGIYGPWTECGDEQLSGNVYHETGRPLPL